MSVYVKRKEIVIRSMLAESKVRETREFIEELDENDRRRLRDQPEFKVENARLIADLIKLNREIAA